MPWRCRYLCMKLYFTNKNKWRNVLFDVVYFAVGLLRRFARRAIGVSVYAWLRLSNTGSLNLCTHRYYFRNQLNMRPTCVVEFLSFILNFSINHLLGFFSLGTCECVLWAQPFGDSTDIDGFCRWSPRTGHLNLFRAKLHHKYYFQL